MVQTAPGSLPPSGPQGSYRGAFGRPRTPPDRGRGTDRSKKSWSLSDHAQSVGRDRENYAPLLESASERARRAVGGNCIEFEVLVAGVCPVFVFDDADLGPLLTEPAIAGIEQTELLAVGHDL